MSAWTPRPLSVRRRRRRRSPLAYAMPHSDNSCLACRLAWAPGGFVWRRFGDEDVLSR